MNVVLLFQQRTIFVRPCPQGYSLTYVGPGGEQKDLGVLETLGTATTAAKIEAFRIGRTKVQVLEGEHRL